MALPQTIGRYEVRGSLGPDGVADAFVATDLEHGRQVVVRVLGDERPSARERFVRQAAVAARLHHPNIANVLELGEHEGRPFIATEYVAGETIASLIRRRAFLPLPRKLQLVIDICHALQYLHEQGLLHGDLAPANVFVERDTGSVKLLQSWITRMPDVGRDDESVVPVTAAYLSPERILARRVDGRSDLFAVGALLYELLVYRQAFAGATPAESADKIVHQQPEPAASIDATLQTELIAILDRALARDPSNRFPTAAAMAAALQNFAPT